MLKCTNIELTVKRNKKQEGNKRMKGNVIVGQSGGPTAAINASLAGVYRTAKDRGANKVYGMLHGIQGLLDEQYIDLSTQIHSELDIELLKRTPSAFLGSCRYKLPEIHEDKAIYEKIFEILNKLDIDAFIYIGGNDSMDTIKKLSDYAILTGQTQKFLGVPKTIDNDLALTDHTPGFGSAAKYIGTSTKEVIRDAQGLTYKKNMITIMEIMGRNAGWLTAAAALARNEYNVAPDLIYLPEVVFDKDKFLADIHEVMKRKRCVVIAVSEGIRDQNGHFLDDDSKYAKKDAFGHVLHSGTGKLLESLVFKEFGCKVRSIELNVLQRCAMHIASKTDLNESFVIGSKAIDKALENVSGHVMGFKRLSNHPYEIDYISTDVREVANYEQKIPVEWINEEGNDITQELYEYLYPLIQGEVHVTYKDGIPSYYSCKHLEK